MTEQTSMARPTMRVLLVEDDDDHAAITEHALKRSPFQLVVDRVSDGVTLMDHLHGRGIYRGRPRPDLILLDLKMPRMSGHEALELIKGDDALATIPVVVLSTSNAELDRLRAYRSHANSFLVKPLEYADYGRMINDVIAYWGQWNESPRDPGQPVTP